MAFRRPFVAAAIVACASLVLGAAPASARPVGYPDTIASAHFLIHYTGDSTASDRVTDQQAADVATIAENAYNAITQTYGYPAPMDDGDGKIDIWIGSTGSADVLGLAFPDTGANQDSGYILVDSKTGLNAHVIAHELFHLVQFGVWAPTDGWMLESTAEWTGFRFEGFPDSVNGTQAAPDMSLDCIGDKCGNDDYERGGYSRWTFFEYLSERFGSTIVDDVLDRGAALNDPTVPAITLLSDVLGAKGTTLSNVFTDWTIANLDGDYTAPGLKGVLPQAFSQVATGAESATLPTQQVAVNHLAARYLVFQRGDGSNSACYSADLTLNVTIPAGISATPTFYWPAVGATPQPLSISGNQASITVPWDTCTWPYGGYLVLQNPSTTADAQVFTVSGSVSVDKSKPAAATAPPPPVTVWGPVVPAPSTDPAPTLTIHAPEVLRVSAKTRLLRFVVYSNGQGRLQAALGGSMLGTTALRTGNNDVRFVLPKTVFAAIKSPRAGANTLTLTSYSQQGTVGSTFTRHVSVQKAAKPKPKPKQKTTKKR
jgi:uncharacterized protein DUF6055